MNVQIEITTRCNFDCFYCAGRDMPQQDMSMEQYLEIIGKHVQQHGVPRSVSLQGEGEPTLNKSLFEIAAHVRSIGSQPYTITNGTYKYPEHFAQSFSAIGVSIDTMDPEEASKIGRHNLDRVLEFVDAAAKILDVNIHTVALSPSCRAVTEWCRQRDLKQTMQPLQAKPDYQYRYPNRVFMHQRPALFQCEFLSHDLMRYYAIDGTEFPCCFIKDARNYHSIDGLRRDLAERRVPGCCTGCQWLK